MQEAIRLIIKAIKILAQKSLNYWEVPEIEEILNEAEVELNKSELD